MKPFFVAVGVLLAFLALGRSDLAAQVSRSSQAGTTTGDFSDHSAALMKASSGLNDMLRAMPPGSNGADAADVLSRLASSASDHMEAIGGMTLLWEVGGKPSVARKLLQSQIDIYVLKVEFLIRELNVYLTMAPAGVAAAGLELRKQLEEAIRLLRGYRI